MAFNDKEQSLESGAPIELYLIEGPSTYRYTSGSKEYTYEGAIYYPVPISRSAPVVNQNESSGGFSIKFPFNNPFVQLFLQGAPPAPFTIAIFQVHLSDSDAEVVPLWKGEVSGVKFADTKATVNVSGLMQRLASQVPRQTFSWTCDHVLYGNRCKVIQDNFTYDFELTGVLDNGLRLTLNDDAQGNPASAIISADSTFFQGGVLRVGLEEGSQRMLLTMAETTPGNYDARLLIPLTDIEVGDAVSISAGCDRSLQTCAGRFSNSRNYGGFPFIPTLNPFATDVKR